MTLLGDIISDVILRIMKSGKVTATARHRIEQLQESGILYDDILDTIAGQNDATSQHVRAFLRTPELKQFVLTTEFTVKMVLLRLIYGSHRQCDIRWKPVIGKLSAT